MMEQLKAWYSLNEKAHNIAFVKARLNELGCAKV